MKMKQTTLLLISCMLMLVGAVETPADPVGSAHQLMRDFGVQLPKERKPAPLFSLPKLGGGEVSLADAYGKLVLLHFWATWCVPCRHEMPLLHRIEQDLDAQKFRMICVNVDRGDSDDVRRFIDKVSPAFHTLLDPAGSVRNRYVVRGLPTTYLIGQDGKIIGRIIGERDWTSPAAKFMLEALLRSDGYGREALIKPDLISTSVAKRSANEKTVHDHVIVPAYVGWLR
ncbi:MAG: TlpA disulfide reductase family protein [Mariprofundus sp.]|nr:TlpA disulfide reductase family protein [Mariprofundus sp.]